MFLVDWFVLRKGGAGAGLSTAAWWAMGTGLAAALSAVSARWLRLQAVAGAALVPVSAVLLVSRVGELWLVALGLALAAAPIAGGAGRLSGDRAWRPAAAVLTAGVALMLASVVIIAADLFVLGDWATSIRVALVLAAGA
ncbi:MAG: hypothetical protein ACR2HM_03270, partial [Acidimicrobiales bacterium]